MLSCLDSNDSLQSSFSREFQGIQFSRNFHWTAHDTHIRTLSRVCHSCQTSTTNLTSDTATTSRLTVVERHPLDVSCGLFVVFSFSLYIFDLLHITLIIIISSYLYHIIIHHRYSKDKEQTVNYYQVLYFSPTLEQIYITNCTTVPRGCNTVISSHVPAQFRFNAFHAQSRPRRSSTFISHQSSAAFKNVLHAPCTR